MTGNYDVQLRWMKKDKGFLDPKPILRQEPRCPTGACMNVLFALLARGLQQNPIVFTSRRDLTLESFGVYQEFYIIAMKDALRLWQQLAITWSDLDMPPPVEAVNRTGRRTFEVTISDVWLQACQRRRSMWSIKFPLPMQATAQNMVLYTFYKGSQAGVNINGFFYHVSGNKRGTYGTPHTPYETWILVKRWYEANGGEVSWARLPYPMVKRTRVSRGMKLVPSQTMHISVVRPKWGSRETNKKTSTTWRSRRRQANQPSHVSA
jgi:hypothetical protein